MSGHVELHLRVRVKSGRRGEFLEFLRGAVTFYEKPGGIRVRLLEDRADPERLIECVDYADEDTFEVDQGRAEHDPEMRRYLERWRSLLDGPPTVEIYRNRTDELGAGAPAEENRS
jgi:quinol monooxygenase YgiN